MTDSQFRILYGILVVLAAVGPVYLFHRFMAPVVSTISYKSGKIAAKFGGPAAYVPVTLVRPGWKMTAYTDPEGWYYFYNVAPGPYTVAIQNTQNIQS